MSNPIDKAIGARIQKRREELTLTPKQLADMLGISEREVIDFEIGAERVHPRMYYKFASVLGVAPRDLFPES